MLRITLAQICCKEVKKICHGYKNKRLTGLAVVCKRWIIDLHFWMPNMDVIQYSN